MKQRLRNLARIAAIVGLAAIIVAVGACLYALTPSGQERIARVVVKQLSATVPGLKVARLGPTGKGWLTAVDVNLYDVDGGRAVHADRLWVRPRWTALFSRRLSISHVRVQGLVVDGQVAADGTLNLATLVRSTPSSGATPPKKTSSSPLAGWSVADLAIIGSRISIQRVGDEPVVVTPLNLQAHASGDSKGFRVTLDELRGELRLPRRPVEPFVVAGDLHRGERVVGVAGWARTQTLGRASWSGAAELAPAGAPASFDVGVQVDQLALSALAALGVPEGTVSGHLTAQGAGVPLQPGGRLTVAVSLADSTVVGVPVDEVHVDASTVDGHWSVSELLVRGAGVTVHGTASGAGMRGRARLELALAHGMPAALKALAPLPPVTGRASFTATVEANGTDDVHFQLVGGAQRLKVGSLGQARELSLDATGTARKTRAWSLTTEGVVKLVGLASPAVAVDAATLSWTARGAVAAPVGSVALRARRLTLREFHVVVQALSADVRGEADRLALTARAQGPQATGELAAEVRRRPNDVTVTLSRAFVDVLQPKGRQKLTLLGPVTVDVREKTDEAVVSNLAVRAQGPIANGEAVLAGLFAWPGRVRVMPHGHLTLGVRKVAVPDVPPIDADLQVDLVPDRAVDVLGGARLRAQLDARLVAGSPRVSVKVDAPLLASGGKSSGAKTSPGLKLASRGPVTASLETTDIELAALPSLRAYLSQWGLTGGRFTARASVSGELTDPHATLVADVRRLEYRDVTGDGRDAVIHRIPGIAVALNVATQAHGVRASTQLSLYGGGFASATGELGMGLADLLRGADPRHAPVSAQVELPRFQISALRSLSDELRDTSGWLSAHGHVSGTLDHPKGVLDLSLVDGRVDQIALGPVTAHAESDGQKVRGTARVQTGATGYLNAQVDLSLTPARRLTATVDMRGLDPGFLRPFVPGLRELGGVVDAQVAMAGPLPQPVFTGRVYFYRGRVGVVGEPTFHDIGVALELEPGRVQLESLQVFSGAGALTGKGQVQLDGLQVASASLTARARRFSVAAAGVSGGRLDGDIDVRLARGDHLITGEAKVPTATLLLPGLSLSSRHPQRVRAHDDVRFVDGASRAAQERNLVKAAMTTPTRVQLRGQADAIFVRSKDLELELDSRLTLRNTAASGTPALFGAIRLHRGRINIGSQRFDFDDSRITFDGGETPRLDIYLRHAYADATVFVELHGTTAHPELRFRSEPAVYDQAQIVSLVLTGRITGAPGGPAPDPTAVIATTVLGKLAAKLAPQLGLDVLRVEKADSTPEQAAAGLLAERVEIGKYVSERLYVSYAHVFGATDAQNANEAQAEYHVTSDWLAQTVFGDAGVGGVDAFWSRRY